MRGFRIAAVASALAPLAALASEPSTSADAATSVAVTGYYYAMRDQSDFGVGVATLDHGQWHFEARYNYEARNAASAFVGWKFSGGDTVSFEVTPIVGALFGAARGVIPGVEASVAWGPFDAYIEAEYVDDRAQAGGSYYYAWSELAWKPVEWLRVGLVGQRTHTVDTDRDLQRGVFAQVTVQRLTFGIYAFNPDSAARYIIASVGARF
jgi:hypothetical protein